MWYSRKLSVVAPAKPLKKKDVDREERVWQITLDHIESGSGQLLKRDVKPYCMAGNSTHWFDERYVLYSKLRPYLNKVLLPDEKGLGTTELVPMLPDPSRLNRKYLAYYLRSPDFVNWISGQTAGAKMPRVSMKVFWDHEIPLPCPNDPQESLKEQGRIASILDKAETIVLKRLQAVKIIGEFLDSVFIDMFGDPVANPKGWGVLPLKKGISSILSGWSAKGDSRPCQKEELGVLKISAVTSGCFKPDENKFVHSETIPESKKLVFPRKGDLLFSRANTRELVAATCIVPRDFNNVFLPDKLWLIKTDAEIMLPEFLNCLLWQPKVKESLTSQATGTSGSMLNISKAKFEETEVIFPPIDLQIRFVGIYKKAIKLRQNFELFAKESEEGFRSLSHKAFAGEL